VWQNGDEIRLSIADTGVGISQVDLEHVFEAFVQVGGAKTGRPGGSGLGLAISRQIVEQHGGRIWAESMLGQGSTFTFALPVSTRASAVGADEIDRASYI
jgi:signal transduction histidine kinase